MIKIVYETSMRGLPRSCVECELNEMCNLCTTDCWTVSIKYHKKRHKDCPLKELVSHETFDYVYTGDIKAKL